MRLGLGTVYEDMDDAYSDDDYYVHNYFKSYINYLNVLCILSCMQQNIYKDYQLCTGSP